MSASVFRILGSRCAREQDLGCTRAKVSADPTHRCERCRVPFGFFFFSSFFFNSSGPLRDDFLRDWLLSIFQCVFFLSYSFRGEGTQRAWRNSQPKNARKGERRGVAHLEEGKREDGSCVRCSMTMANWWWQVRRSRAGASTFGFVLSTHNVILAFLSRSSNLPVGLAKKCHHLATSSERTRSASRTAKQSASLSMACRRASH